jgi:hypothetical protein
MVESSKNHDAGDASDGKMQWNQICYKSLSGALSITHKNQIFFL